MHGVGAGGSRRRDDLRRVEVALARRGGANADREVGLANVRRAASASE